MIPVKDNIPTDRFPFVTVALIVANVVVYIAAIWHGGSLISGPDSQEVVKYGAIPYAITHPSAHCGFVALHGGAIACTHHAGLIHALPWWETIFTAMFMHASILHIAGNMLFLWLFGNTLEDSMGRVRFIVFYFLGGIVAELLQIVVSPGSQAATVGAGGAVAAVLGGYMVLYVGARVIALMTVPLYFTVVEIPPLVMLGVFVAIQAVFAATGLTHPVGGTAGAAYVAWIGGLIFGLLTIRLLARNRKPTPPTRVVTA